MGKKYAEHYKEKHKEFALSVFEMFNEEENANLDPILIENLEKDQFMICDHDENKLVPMDSDEEFMKICNDLAEEYDMTCYYGFRYKEFGTPAFLAVTEGIGDGVVSLPSTSSLGLAAGMFYIDKNNEVGYTIKNIKLEDGMIKLASPERPYEETHPDE